ncbi:MAG TPA: TolC family protein [Limnochordales bacterium]
MIPSPARYAAGAGVRLGLRLGTVGPRVAAVRLLAAVVLAAALAVAGLGMGPSSTAWAAGAAADIVHESAAGGAAALPASAGGAGESATAPASAAAPADPAEPVAYDAVRVVERALAYHLGVRAGQLQYWLGQARAEEARSQLRPFVSLEASPFGFRGPVTQQDSDLGGPQGAGQNIEGSQLPMGQGAVTGVGYRVAVSARVPVWQSSLQRATGTLAELEGEQARDDAETAIGMAIVQSLEAYYGVLRAEAARRVAAAALAEAEYKSREQAIRMEVGTATEMDWLQAEAERHQAQAELVRADGELLAARMALNQSLGYPLETELPVVEWTPPPSWPDLEEALRLASERAEVQKARRDLERARAAQLIAQEQSKPVLQLVGRYRWPVVELNVSLDRHGYLGASVSAAQQFVDGHDIGSQASNWMAGVELRWPLLDGDQRRAQLAQAALQVELAALQLEQLEQSTRAEVMAAHARLLAATEALRGAEQAVQAARRGLDIAEQLRAVGAATTGDVLRAETAVARAEQARLEAAYTVTLAQTAYLRAAGVLVSHWLTVVGEDLALEQPMP